MLVRVYKYSTLNSTYFMYKIGKMHNISRFNNLLLND